MQTILNKSGYHTPKQAAAAERMLAEQRDLEVRRLAAQLRRDNGVFPRYAAAILDDVELPRQSLAPEDFENYLAARDELRTLLDAPGILVIRGENGPGKTHLVSALVNAFCDRGRPAFYCRAIDFFAKVKSTFGQSGKTLEDLERRFRAYHLLAIDEIEVRSDSAWENALLRSLIDARYANVVATVIVTNKSEEDLNAYFSPAIRDRIRESGGVVNCDWGSLRGRKGCAA